MDQYVVILPLGRSKRATIARKGIGDTWYTVAECTSQDIARELVSRLNEPRSLVIETTMKPSNHNIAGNPPDQIEKAA